MNAPGQENLLLKIRKAASPGEWKAGLLGLSKSQNSSSEPGLVMIQIDGLSMPEFRKALERNEMPFLKRLVKKENYQIYSHYPGLPSTTPSVQGELFYGVKQIVPAFFFFDRGAHKIFRMFDGDSVREIERRLAEQGEGLLTGGSSYSNIFTGGSSESHFCASSLGWDQIWKDVNLFNLFLLMLTHLIALVRMTVLALWESVLALVDFVYGLLKKEDPGVEFKFVPVRVLLCILLRELITLGAVIDVARGLPVIHLNFLGYDEQAHRRGPASPTAHWALGGIDAAIARVYSAALYSSRRHYDVWIYSDHGQEETIPYMKEHKRTVDQAVADVFQEVLCKDKAGAAPETAVRKNEIFGIQFQRVRYFGKWIERIWPLNHHAHAVPAEDFQCVTAAIGPLGHVYLFQELTPDEQNRFAEALVRKAHVPLVLAVDGEKRVRAWNEQGAFALPEDGEQILDPRHPYFNEVMKDLTALCRHPNAGTFVISGWRRNGTPYNFPFEHGAHAGPGEKEIDAFALLPAGVAASSRDRGYLRTSDLRKAALRWLNRSGADGARDERSRSFADEERRTIRIMTYNVHSCIGMDGKVSPRRIARVIGQYEPDIVALQELDMGRARTGTVDQPHLIAKELEMLYHFHPSFEVEEEKYGNAVLSRYPMDLVCAMKLPKLKSKLSLEPRGAIWVSVEIGGVRLQIINTHLSFYRPECEYQVRTLMSPEWIGHAHCAPPAVLCGDFNCVPRSGAWRMINERLGDAQHLLDNHRPLATWFGHYPIGRIDHVFVSSGIKVSAIEVPQTQLNKLASDHLPLIVDVEIISG